MTQKEMLKTIISTLDKKKAESIQAIKISDLTILADYFIIASGNSSTQTNIRLYVLKTKAVVGDSPARSCCSSVKTNIRK